MPVRRSGVGDGEHRYRAAWWLPGAHAQTIWGRYAKRYPRLSISTECHTTPDGDNLEIHSIAGDADAPRVLLLHGLEGSVRSHYVGGVFSHAHQRGWGASLLVHRGCGSAPNLARRFYHSGETTDLAFAFSVLAARSPSSRWLLAGVSLGGNMLLKWLGERGKDIDSRICAAAAVSAPFDLEAGAHEISRGFARVYDRRFLTSLRRKALAKLVRYPDLFDREKLARATSVIEFDDAVTAPVHGFASAHDYYVRSSSVHFLTDIRVPTLLLSARDDPFLPAAALDTAARVAAGNPVITTEVHDHGGHVGFVSGAFPWTAAYYAEARAYRFFDAAMERAQKRGYDS
ncbi:MAG: alpha/beta fold hydrolase [Gemmatimonadaceae bacterium]